MEYKITNHRIIILKPIILINPEIISKVADELGIRKKMAATTKEDAIEYTRMMAENIRPGFGLTKYCIMLPIRWGRRKMSRFIPRDKVPVCILNREYLIRYKKCHISKSLINEDELKDYVIETIDNIWENYGVLRFPNNNSTIMEYSFMVTKLVNNYELEI